MAAQLDMLDLSVKGADVVSRIDAIAGTTAE